MDLDGDGTLDVISGSWPGEIFFFRGLGKGQYAAPSKLKHKNGKTMNIGGGRRPDSGGMLLIAGDATYEKTDKGTVIIYDGERIEVPEGKSAGITGTASAVFAVDWNGDGTLDLLVGDIGGNVYFVQNEGEPGKNAFGVEKHLEVEGKAIQIPGGDAGPIAADWDGDGKTDLLVGAGDGSVWFYRNVGTAKEPKLAAGVELVPKGEVEYGPNAPKEPRRGHRSKICVADWDGDGKLDLLVGDFATQKPDRPEPTADEKAGHDKLRAELNKVMERYRELSGKMFGNDKPKEKAEQDKLKKEFEEVQTKMSEIRDKLPPEYENHGWVWFFRRL